MPYIFQIEIQIQKKRNIYFPAENPNQKIKKAKKIFCGLLVYISHQAGGVLAILTSQFQMADGFSNGLVKSILRTYLSHFILFSFFGWGGEDDDFFQRLSEKVF